MSEDWGNGFIDALQEKTCGTSATSSALTTEVIKDGLDNWDDDMAAFRKLNAQVDVLYRMARLARNTDGLHPSTAGPAMGQLLGELRRLDVNRYDKEVMK